MARKTIDQIFKKNIETAKTYWETIRKRPAYREDYAIYVHLRQRSELRSAQGMQKVLHDEWKMAPLQNPDWDFDDLRPDEKWKDVLRKLEAAFKTHNERLFFEVAFPIFGHFERSFQTPIDVNNVVRETLTNAILGKKPCLTLTVDLSRPKVELMAWFEGYIDRYGNRRGKKLRYAKTLQEVVKKQEKDAASRYRIQPLFLRERKVGRFTLSFAEMCLLAAREMGYSLRRTEKELKEIPQSRKTLAKILRRALQKRQRTT